MEQSKMNSLGIDIGSTTVKISILDPDQKILFPHTNDTTLTSRRR